MWDMCSQQGIEFLEAVAALDTGAAERCRRAFWRRVGRSGARLATRKDVCTWLRRAEMRLHQRAVDLLLPDVLRPIPSQLTQVGTWLRSTTTSRQLLLFLPN